jgi:hypothetical protein
LIADGLWCFEFPFIYGKIATDENEFVDSVHVFLSRLGQPLHEHTMGDGSFYFYDDCPEILDSLSIHCTRDGNYRNGVSTLDLIKVQKHLLGLEYLDNPYKLIAADVNNSGSISVLDIVDMRKLILRLTNEFPHNRSWRFVPDDFSFQDPTHPWPFPEILEVKQRSGLDFIGIKIGDVNGNVNPGIRTIEGRRPQSALVLQMPDMELIAGETYQIPLCALNMIDVEGFQFTIAMNGIDFRDVRHGFIDITSDHVGRHRGAITMSWGTVVPVTRSSEDVLFTVEIVAKQNGQLSEMLEINSDITEAESYTMNAGGEEMMDVLLKFWDARTGHDYVLFQNEPNPYSGQTKIGCYFPNATSATLTLFDMQGTRVYEIEDHFSQGYHNVLINRENLNGSGTYFYILQSADFIATKKMVLLDKN